MPDSGSHHQLLTDILSDATFIARREQLLAECGKGLQRRRQRRTALRLMIPLAAVLALTATLVTWRTIHGAGPRAPVAVSAVAAHGPVKRDAATKTAAAGIFVSTAEILATSSSSFSAVSTNQVSLGLQIISDQELLALLGDHGAMLLGGQSSMELWLPREGYLQAVR